MAKGTERLRGVRVLVTRPVSAAARLADAFAAEGAVVHRVPALAIAPVEDTKSAERLRRRLAGVSVIVFTSVNAVEGFFGLVPGAAPDRLPAAVLAVGPATAEALRVRGVAGVRTPRDRSDSEGLLSLPALGARRVADADPGIVVSAAQIVAAGPHLEFKVRDPLGLGRAGGREKTRGDRGQKDCDTD